MQSMNYYLYEIYFFHGIAHYGLTISALLFLLGSCTSCWLAMLVWPVPLWYRLWFYPVEWYESFVWYSIAAAGHYISIGIGLYTLLGGPWYAKMAVPVGAFLYYYIVTVVWMSVSSHLQGKFRRRQHAEKLVLSLVIWVITTWLYITFITDYSLIIGDMEGGYLLFSPLIPLVDVPIVLLPMRWCGERIFLFFMLGIQAGGTWCLVEKIIPTKIIVFCRVLLGMVRVSEHSLLGGECAHDIVALFSRCGVVLSQFEGNDICQVRKHVVAHVHDVIMADSNISCVLFPESSVYTPNVIGEKGEVIHEVGSLEGKTIILGGFRKQGDAIFNTVWYLASGTVIDYFDKQYILPFTEAFSRNSWCINNCTITPGDRRNQRPSWEISPGFCVVPYICSEFFTAHVPRDAYNDSSLLVVCNNLWAPEVFRWMMMRAAVFRAIAWQRTVLYVAHGYSLGIAPYCVRYGLCEEKRVCHMP